jgi:hypothetical protein
MDSDYLGDTRHWQCHVIIVIVPYHRDRDWQSASPPLLLLLYAGSRTRARAQATTQAAECCDYYGYHLLQMSGIASFLLLPKNQEESDSNLNLTRRLKSSNLESLFTAALRLAVTSTGSELTLASASGSGTGSGTTASAIDPFKLALAVALQHWHRECHRQ